MTYHVVISEQAEQDLRRIYSYIAFDLLSPMNAAGQLERLECNIMELQQLPERFRLYEKEPWHSRGLRIMPVDNYVVFYITDQKKELVTIIRVMYQGQNINRHLKET